MRHDVECSLTYFDLKANNDREILGVDMEKSLLKILVCPQSGAPLELSKNEDELICHASNLAYPIKEGVPVLLVSEARELGGQGVDDE